VHIEGTGIQADGFSGHAPVLLSHYHQDHMQGLERLSARRASKAGSEANGFAIYCSPITARLLCHIDKIAHEHVVAVEPGEEFEPRPGVRVAVLESNHCMGSVMFFIEASGRRILYTGDFRLNDAIRRSCAALPGIDELYLDCTYDHPHYRFPPQHEAVEQVLQIIRRSQARVVNVAAYTIGKDRVLQAIHEEFHEPIYVTEQKYEVYQAIGMERLATRKKDDTRFRAYSRGYFGRYFKMGREYRSGESLVIIPTGWAVDAGEHDPYYHYVPYSEHCDYAELTEFKHIARAGRVISL